MARARNQYIVLNYLAGEAQPVPGIDVADGIAGTGRSSVYAALAALQRDGLIDAEWDHSTSHPRRLVQINGSGRDALRAEQEVRGIRPGASGSAAEVAS